MLTVKKINSLETLPKQYKVSDGRGLYLLVHPNGSKYWRYDYQFDSKRKTISYGVYPKVSLAQARLKHSEAQSQLEVGTDPSRSKKTAQQAIKQTFRNVAEEWYSKWREGKNEKYQANTWTRLNNNVFPKIGDISVAELTPLHFKSLINDLVEKGVYDIAKRTLQTCNQIMRYAYIQEYIPFNPTSEIFPRDIIPKRKKRNYVRLTEQELPQLISDIKGYSGSEVTVLAIRFMMHTFVRTQELIKATWDEINFEQKRWSISAERMKMRRTHIVPLSNQALAILEQLKAYQKDSNYIFPSDIFGSKKHMSNNTILFALYRMGYRGRMTGHGFRGVASTILHEQGYESDHIELQLAHDSQSEVKGAYNYAEYLPQREIMMQDWSDYLESLGDGC